jgi:hypothetical protein
VTLPAQRVTVGSTLAQHKSRLRAAEALTKGAFQIDVLGPSSSVPAGDQVADMMVPRDLDGTTLLDTSAGVSGVASGEIEIWIRNVTTGEDMLSTPITIQAGETSSYAVGTTQPVIDDEQALVRAGDIIAIDVDAASDGVGLKVVLVYG